VRKKGSEPILCAKMRKSRQAARVRKCFLPQDGREPAPSCPPDAPHGTFWPFVSSIAPPAAAPVALPAWAAKPAPTDGNWEVLGDTHRPRTWAGVAFAVSYWHGRGFPYNATVRPR